MFSSCINNKSSKQEISYPCLMKFNSSDEESFVVLFSEDTVGTVVYVEKNSSHHIGEHSRYWISSKSTVDWKLLTEDLILSNG